jgi:hypothetical protein
MMIAIGACARWIQRHPRDLQPLDDLLHHPARLVELYTHNTHSNECTHTTNTTQERRLESKKRPCACLWPRVCVCA